MKKSSSRAHGSSIPFGFSLIELLVVVAVIAVAIGLSVPAMVQIARGQGMKRAVAEVSGLVEQGRVDAMATSTWAWLGLSQQESGGRPELLAVLVASKDGTPNMASTNLRMLSLPIRIENVQVLTNLTSWASTNEVLPLSKGKFSFSRNIRGVTVNFSATVLGFSPRGEATIDPDAVSPWIEIGLREMRGNVEIPSKTASIRVSGFSGELNVDY